METVAGVVVSLCSLAWITTGASDFFAGTGEDEDFGNAMNLGASGWIEVDNSTELGRRDADDTFP